MLINDDKKLQQADALTIKDLRPEFQQQLREVKQNVYGESLRPMMVQGKPLNGSMFAGLFQANVATINSCGVPVTTSSWEGVTESECRKAMTTATETFKKILSALHLPIDDEYLSDAIKCAAKHPLTYYHAAAIDYKASDLGDNLLKRAEGVKATCVRSNAAQSK
ncbi:hypothetical protein PsorP6_006016 [Peronosclerospora sorghi]|uniref:Uncharacterized protein n=1 Tax=Peronosclerospora sorghi TaxID=230839 RepID=A0ACC0W3R1_9STRA|nr:hypothetical protein PsorP6_006016 [Peronosclerospora sorghi]